MFLLDTKILVIDDMMMARMLARRALNDLGYNNIVEAIDGEEGWKTLESEDDIGLIISDWNMPHLSGFDLLKRVRADHRFQKIPFMMITAEGDATQIQAALQEGVDGYLTKPLDFTLFKAKLEYTYRKYIIQNAP